jgi:hypothetical protein
MFGKKPAPTPTPIPKSSAAPAPVQSARPAGWAVQVLTADYLISGYMQPVDMPLVGNLNVPTQPTLTLTQAQLRPIAGQAASDTLPEITIPKTAIVALIPRDEASAKSAALQMPPTSQRAVIYAGPYLIRAAFRLAGDMHMRTLFGASTGTMLAVSEASVLCLKPGGALPEQNAPVIILNKAAVQAYHSAA